MASPYPNGTDTFTNPTGTQFLSSPDHALEHTDANNAILAVQIATGTHSGTNVLKSFVAGDFPARINSTGVLQQVITGTVNNSVINNATLGTPTLQGAVVNTANIVGSAVTSPKVQLTMGIGTTTGTVAAGTAFTAIPGGTYSIINTVASNLFINAVWYVAIDGTSSAFAGELKVNGTIQPIMSQLAASGAVVNATIPQNYVIPVASGTQTLILGGVEATGTDLIRMLSTHSGITYLVTAT